MDPQQSEILEFDHLCTFTDAVAGEERKACLALDPKEFYIRRPPAPHHFSSFVTHDDNLFQTIHMGAPVIDLDRYSITVDGLLKRPFTLSLENLKQLPASTITAFHECYGSPTNPPTQNLWRIGNVTWTGVSLRTLLGIAQPLAEAHFVWSEGLDFGEFAGIKADRFQKDLPIIKAISPEVLLAYEMNGEPISRNRGGPVRLVVPGWYGTNMTKWLCRLSLQAHRAPGPFTTKFYNEKDPTDSNGRMRPVWMVEPNSMIVHPCPHSQLKGPVVEVTGWAWSEDGIQAVQISADENRSWMDADVEQRQEFSWQMFRTTMELSSGVNQLTVRAISASGLTQPISGRRNHVHSVQFEVR